jgi:hypothetical protein
MKERIINLQKREKLITIKSIGKKIGIISLKKEIIVLVFITYLFF